MADLSDVENTLVTLIAQAIYPTGSANPSALIVGSTHVPCRISRGWPKSSNLDSDLAAGYVNVTVFPMNIERNVTRYNREWHTLPYSNSTITVTANQGAGTVTLGGTLPNPYAVQNFAVAINESHVYAYTLQSGDTLTQVATALATLIAVDFAGTTSTGQVITVVGATQITASVGVVAGTIREIKRQVRVIRIVLWCFNPAVRDAAGILLDPAISQNLFLTMPDGTAARIRSETAPAPDDMTQKDNLFRRDLVYGVEYSTSQTQQAEQVTAVKATLIEPVLGVLKTVVTA